MTRFQPVLLALTVLSSLGFGTFPGAAQGAPVEIVAFGDSLSAGYGLGPGESFPEQLEAALRERGRDVTVANAGVSGDTTAGGLERLDWSIPETTDLVILELGANDALRGVAPGVTRENLDAMLQRLSARESTRVILAGMLAPPNMGGDYAQAFDAIYPDLARTYDVALYPFFLDGVAAESSLNLSDAMHPNAAGIAVIVERILPMVERELDALPADNG